VSPLSDAELEGPHRLPAPLPGPASRSVGGVEGDQGDSATFWPLEPFSR